MTKKCHPEDITDWIQDITEVNILNHFANSKRIQPRCVYTEMKSSAKYALD